MLMKLTLGVNFTNILWAAVTHANPKSAIKLHNLTVFFALLGSARLKAVCKMLVKLTFGYVHPKMRDATFKKQKKYNFNYEFCCRDLFDRTFIDHKLVVFKIYLIVNPRPALSNPFATRHMWRMAV